MRNAFPLALLISATSVWGQTPAKKPLDHSVYDGWKAIGQNGLSRDGKYVAYIIAPQEGDGVLTVRRNSDGRTVTIARGSGFRFSRDSRYLVATVVPAFLESRDARRAKKKPEDMPKSGLAVVDLDKLTVTEIPKVSSWSLPEEDRGWIAYRPEPPKPEPPKSEAPKPEASKPEAAKQPEPAKKEDAPKKKADHRAGDPLAIASLATPTVPTLLPDVTSFAWSRDGSKLAYATSTKDGAGDGVGTVSFPNGRPRVDPLVMKGLGRYTKLVLSSNGDHLAFLSDRDDYAAKKPIPSLYRALNGRSEKIVAPANAAGWIVNGDTTPRFSESGKRMIYGIGPKPVDPAEVPDDEKVALDVWNWKDPLLQPMQLLQARNEASRTYTVIHEAGRSQLVADGEVRGVVIPAKGDARYGYALETLPYGSLISWDGSYADLYRVDLQNGQRVRLKEKVRGGVEASPDGQWLAVYDEEKQRLTVVDVATGNERELSTGTNLFDERDDHPDFPSAYGLEWTKDNAILVNDRYDVWRFDPTGRTARVRITDGRANGIVYRRVAVQEERDGVDAGDMYFSSFSERSKDAGFFRRKAGRTVAFVPMSPVALTGWRKAEDADTMIFREGTTVRFPELRVTDTSFRSPVVVTDVGEQIKPYNWLTSELVTWQTGDGAESQGILYKPEDFDASKKYPMIAYFYERDSDGLHQHRSPAPSASTINIPLFVSQGYLVFVPDIPYKVGYPGESAVSAIVSGVNALINTRPYIDPKRLGIQGQSWGGYQVAYLVTETNMFAAAGAGAPVSNMISAYGGIRYGSGMVRQFQYERQQSRIGGTPWNALQRYIENSPIFFADKVNTPLLMMHNDKDGAVPWTQGIEYFTALRRLQKPVWMLVYNDEDHNLVQRKNRKDLSIRLSQFFDHYLKGAPAPVWMEKGVPAVEKGRTMGTELTKPASASKS